MCFQIFSLLPRRNSGVESDRMGRGLDCLVDDGAGGKLLGRNRQLAGLPHPPLCRSVLALSPIGLISLSYNAIKWDIIDTKLSCLKPPAVPARPFERGTEEARLTPTSFDCRRIRSMTALTRLTGHGKFCRQHSTHKKERCVSNHGTVRGVRIRKSGVLKWTTRAKHRHTSLLQCGV